MYMVNDGVVRSKHFALASKSRQSKTTVNFKDGHEECRNYTKVSHFVEYSDDDSDSMSYDTPHQSSFSLSKCRREEVASLNHPVHSQDFAVGFGLPARNPMVADSPEELPDSESDLVSKSPSGRTFFASIPAKCNIDRVAHPQKLIRIGVNITHRYNAFSPCIGVFYLGLAPCV